MRLIMIGYFKMLLNLLYYLISFYGYVGKRLFRMTEQRLRLLGGLQESEKYNLPPSTVQWMHVNPLEIKTYSSVTGIFLPILTELKLYNGEFIILKPLASRHSITTDRNFQLKTVSVIDKLNIIYDGSLTFMSYEFHFFINIALENVKIFTELNVTPNGCKSIVDNLCIDGINLELSAFNLTLRNTSSYRIVSYILKIGSFLFLCLLELIIKFSLNLKFSSTDFVRIHAQDHTLNNSLTKYFERTKNVVFSSSTAESFTSVLNDALIEDCKKVLIQYFPRFQYGSNMKVGDKFEVQGGDAFQVQGGDARLVTENKIKRDISKVAEMFKAIEEYSPKSDQRGSLLA